MKGSQVYSLFLHFGLLQPWAQANEPACRDWLALGKFAKTEVKQERAEFCSLDTIYQHSKAFVCLLLQRAVLLCLTVSRTLIKGMNPPGTVQSHQLR